MSLISRIFITMLLFVCTKHKCACLPLDRLYAHSEYLRGKFPTPCCHTCRHFILCAGVSSILQERDDQYVVKLTAAKWFAVALVGKGGRLQCKYCQSALPVGSQRFSPHQLGLRWWWFHCRQGRPVTNHASCYATVGCSCTPLPLPTFLHFFSSYEASQTQTTSDLKRSPVRREQEEFLFCYHSFISIYCHWLDNKIK